MKPVLTIHVDTARTRYLAEEMARALDTTSNLDFSPDPPRSQFYLSAVAGLVGIPLRYWPTFDQQPPAPYLPIDRLAITAKELASFGINLSSKIQPSRQGAKVVHAQPENLRRYSGKAQLPATDRHAMAPQLSITNSPGLHARR